MIGRSVNPPTTLGSAPLHSSHHHNCVGTVQRRAFRQDAVYGRDACVVDTLYVSAQGVSCDRCFFSHWEVGSSC